MKKLLGPLILFVVATVSAQTFDVASVKLHEGPGRSANVRLEPTTLEMTNIGLAFVIKWAYGLQLRQLSSMPDWMLSGYSYDIEAKTSAPVSEATMREMLKNLLAERFGLKFHWVTKPTRLDVMRIPAAVRKNFTPSNLLKMQFPKLEGATASGRLDGVAFSDLADQLSGGESFGNPTIDGTNMPGHWSFTLTWNVLLKPANDSPDSQFVMMADNAASMRKALTEQLGVTFTRELYPVKTIVIDHANLNPTPN